MYWKKWPRKRSRDKANRPRLWPACCALLVLMGTPVKGADRVQELQERFDRETHAMSKVRALVKLAEAQFDAARKAGGSGDYMQVGLTLEKYRDNVRTALQLLRRQEPDADRHHTGYRMLELQVRKGLREVEQTLLTAPLQMRPPLELVRKDLVDMDDDLIGWLFPRRDKQPEKAP